MSQSKTKEKINIRPDVGVYATYRRLSYRPWHAIAEFVDNSTQNYYNHKNELLALYEREGAPGKLRVQIAYDHEENSLIIIDNANGMNFEELTRAVVLDKPPPDRSGRCEYGMGLKTAACWFGKAWTIQTCRLNSGRELTVTVNVEDLASKRPETLDVLMRMVDHHTHFTNITIHDLYKPIRGRTQQRIRDQLGSMYRMDLRTHQIEIDWNGAPVSFDEPPIFKEELEDKTTNVWKKNVSFTVPWESERRDLHVHGWIGIRLPGSVRDGGFVLFRRGRVVMGGPDEGYKPSEIFGQANSFQSQRLIGELQLDDWPVTQAKDAFDWSGGLEDLLIDQLAKVSKDYSSKAATHREKNARITKGDLDLASEKPREIFSDPGLGKALDIDIRFPEPAKTEKQVQVDTAKLKKMSIGPTEYTLRIGSNAWLVRIHWLDQLSDANWMQVEYPQDDQIDIILNMAHPFFASYMDSKDILELLQKFVLSLALAEKMARLTATKDGLIDPGDIRTHMNRVLRRAGEIEAKKLG